MSGKTADALLAGHAKAQDYCNLCPRMCHPACPVSNATYDVTVTPREKNAAAGLARRGARAFDEETARLFYACTSCRACTEWCEHDNDVAASLLTARAAAVSRGVELPEVRAVRARIEETGNPWGEDLRARVLALPRDRKVGERGPVRADHADVPVVPGRGLRLYWPGCDTLHHRPDLLEKTLAVADRLGEPDLVVYAGEVQCCGYALLSAGHLDRFRAHARRLADELKGVRRIWTASPECAWTFSVAFPEYAGIDPPAKVAHVVDLLLPALRHAPSRPPVALEAAYHDPCFLGRHLGRYDAPREIANRLLKTPLVEQGPWNRETSYCCGGGGLLPHTDPATADAITRQRVADLTGSTSGPPGEAAPGPRAIVTACPTCEGRFRDAGATVHDVVDVLAAYLGLGEP